MRLKRDIEGGDYWAPHVQKLVSFTEGHRRSMAMASYLRIEDRELAFERAMGKLDRSQKLDLCAKHLVFRDYYRAHEVRLHEGYFCQQPLLCPVCASLRAARAVARYFERFQALIDSEPIWGASMLTLTMKDQEDLESMFDQVEDAFSKLLHRRHKAAKFKTEMGKVLGGVGAVEVTRGSRSGLWHVHVHCLILHSAMIDKAALQGEWEQCLGVSPAWIDIRSLEGWLNRDRSLLMKSFCEVFKYQLKFSSLNLADNLRAYHVLRGRRMLRSFGVFRGVKVPESLLEDPLENEAFRILIYRYVGGGYELRHRSDGSQGGESDGGDPEIDSGSASAAMPVDEPAGNMRGARRYPGDGGASACESDGQSSGP